MGNEIASQFAQEGPNMDFMGSKPFCRAAKTKTRASFNGRVEKGLYTWTINYSGRSHDERFIQGCSEKFTKSVNAVRKTGTITG